MTSYKNAPIRQLQIDKITRELKDIEEREKRKLTHLEKIYHIFSYRFKHFDTEQEEENKGVSVRELALILGTNKITMQDIIKAENGDVVAKEDVYRTVQNVKKSIRRFNKWKETAHPAHTNDTGFNIHCLRTKKGKWYYYNVMNDKDIQKVELHRAKIHMGIEKAMNRNIDILEMRPAERERSIEEYSQELKDKNEKRRIRKEKKNKEKQE